MKIEIDFEDAIKAYVDYKGCINRDDETTEHIRNLCMAFTNYYYTTEKLIEIIESLGIQNLEQAKKIIDGKLIDDEATP
jgi:hypothetical protein